MIEPSMGDLDFSKLTKDLRKELDAMNVKWHDASEGFKMSDGHVFLRERTKVFIDGIEVASCIWGHSGTPDDLHGGTYGYPDKLECMSSLFHDDDQDGIEPKARTVEEIVSVVEKELHRQDEGSRKRTPLT